MTRWPVLSLEEIEQVDSAIAEVLSADKTSLDFFEPASRGVPWESRPLP